MLKLPTKFEVRRWHTLGFSINRPGDLDLWPFNLEPGARYCLWGGQSSYQFWYFWHFLFLTYGPTHVRRTTWPCDLDLWLRGHGDCRWYGSSCSISARCLKLVGLPFQKIWYTFNLSINRPGDLDLWPWNWCALLSREMGNLCTNFGVSRSFRSRLTGQHMSDASRDLATLTFDLEGHGACRWYGSLYSICVPSLNS